MSEPPTLHAVFGFVKHIHLLKSSARELVRKRESTIIAGPRSDLLGVSR